VSARTFILANAVAVVAFALGGLVAPGPFWSFFGVAPVDPVLSRIMAWYLLTFGLGGLVAARDPQRHALAAGLLGVEKIGAAAGFAACQWVYGVNVPLAAVGAFDAVMAVLLIRLAWSKGAA